MLLLHEAQDMADFHRFRHIQNRPHNGSNIFRAASVGQEQISQMHKSDDLILVLYGNRISGMLRFLHDLHIFFPSKIRVQAIHIGSRQHHLAGQ
ncbi:hypothetical protein D3C77_560300 [compost metagenome]